MKRYDPKTIEPKWQKIWQDTALYDADDTSTKPKVYATPMLPYPSGAGLHTGHVRNYSIADAVARYYRQKGHNVLSTIAWDAFGLPAENYAIKTGTPPAQSTAQNIAYFKEQVQKVGLSVDWSREFNTSDPDYYRWTQWVFSFLYKRGLAYQAEKSQWWCDNCKTVLADEQVIAGKCWRHDGADDPLVTKKSLKQWFFKITYYADDILDATDALDWPEKIKTMQKNWIGRSEGAVVNFELQGLGADGHDLTVFTTAIETIYGVTFMVLAPEHPLVAEYGQLADNAEAINEYVTHALRKSDIDREKEKDKTGVAIEGLYAINPASGEKIPIWVADYVLMGYGSGAIMAVPGQDDRDFAFAEKYDLPIRYTTTRGEFVNYGLEIKPNKKAFTMANSGEFDGMDLETAREAISKKLQAEGRSEPKVTYKIRDWLISRQRYWGAPIPIIHCEEHGAVLVPEEQLPVTLPAVEKYAPDGSNHSVLSAQTAWVTVPCPTCGKPSKRETDTMDGYVCSTWYLHRYTDAHNDKEAFSSSKANHWFPLDFYFGGDHAVAHLLYIRFLQRVFVDAGIMSPDTIEPVKKLVYNGYINAEDGSKMSKSKGNTVDPLDIIKAGYGADALRVFELFIAPYDQDTPWNNKGVPGTYRFLNRLWVLTQEFLEQSTPDNEVNDVVLRATHKAIAKVTDDLDTLSFNTAVSAMMECVNTLYKIKQVDGFKGSESWRFALESLVQLLAPFAPHITEELWHELGHDDSVHVNHWPKFDETYLHSDTMRLAVQVNGKVRAEITVAMDATEDEVTVQALKQENVQTHLQGREPKKIIYVPNRLVSIVV
jgi:leucyl-tRNA synthetase